MSGDLVGGHGPEVFLVGEQVAGDRDLVEVLGQGLRAQGDVRDRVDDLLGSVLVGPHPAQELLGRFEVDDTFGQSDDHGFVHMEGVGLSVHDDAAIVAVELAPAVDAASLAEEYEPVGVAEQMLNDLLGVDVLPRGELVAVFGTALEDIVSEDLLEPVHIDVHHRVVVSEDVVVASQTVVPEPGTGQVGGAEEPELGVFLAVASSTVGGDQLGDLLGDLLAHLELGAAHHRTAVVFVVDGVTEDRVCDLHVVASQDRCTARGERVVGIRQDIHDSLDEHTAHGTRAIQLGLHRHGYAASELPEAVVPLHEARQAQADGPQMRISLGVDRDVKLLGPAVLLLGLGGGAATAAGGGAFSGSDVR